MPTLDATIDAFLAAREYDQATLARLAVWSELLGPHELIAITPEMVDQALIRLAERGRLKPRRGAKAQPIGSPLSGATMNRYLAQLQTLFKYARRLRLVPRTHLSPAHGIERQPEPADPARYLRPEEVERLLKVARVLDTRWGRLPALILTAFHTGLRVGNLMTLRWSEVDLKRRTLTVLRTKNGQPMVAVLSARAALELSRLDNQSAATLVFEGQPGRPFAFRGLWAKVCTEAGLPHRNFHQLRHGCGSALATAGVNQAQIMAVMGHRTLTASARYLHQNTDDRRRVIDQVFS